MSPGNDFNSITIQSKEVIERAKKNNYPFTEDGNKYVLKSPDGYAFHVVDENPKGADDPVKGVTMNTTDIEKTHSYWHKLLTMKVLSKTETDLVMSYSEAQAFLAFNRIGKINGSRR